VSVRIVNPAVKIGYVVIGYVVGILVTISGALTLALPAASALAMLYVIGVVAFAVRIFRGDTEPVEPA